MMIVATTAAISVVSALSSTVPMVYMASTGTIQAVGYPTLDLVIALSYGSTDALISEATLLAARPNALKVLEIRA